MVGLSKDGAKRVQLNKSLVLSSNMLLDEPRGKIQPCNTIFREGGSYMFLFFRGGDCPPRISVWGGLFGGVVRKAKKVSSPDDSHDFRHLDLRAWRIASTLGSIDVKRFQSVAFFPLVHFPRFPPTDLNSRQ